MMSEDFILWRCLHGGPLSAESIEQWPPDQRIPWAEFRARNVPLLAKLTRVYGGCAVVAREGDRIVGMLRFYPKAVAGREFCLQQAHPAGPAEDFARAAFPPLEQLSDRTVVVHCLMTGSPHQKDNPYQRKGIGARMARHLIEWARQRGWQAIEATAYRDLDIVYGVTGVAGKRFWEKLGFRVVEEGTEPGFECYPDILRVMIEQGRALGLSAEEVKRKYTMRLDLA
jgi:hypothetical protein